MAASWEALGAAKKLAGELGGGTVTVRLAMPAALAIKVAWNRMLHPGTGKKSID